MKKNINTNINKKKNNNMKKSFFSYMIIISFFVIVYFVFNMMNSTVNELSYGEFINNMEEGNITEIEITPSSSQSTYTLEGKLEGYESDETFEVKIPLSDNIITKVMDSVDEDVSVIVNKDPAAASFWLILINIIPLIFFGLVAFYFINKQVSGAGKSFDFGKSKVKLTSYKSK